MLKTKKLLGTICACTATIFVLSSAEAQEVDNRTNVYGGISQYFFDSDSDVDDDTGMSFGAEIPVASRWALALERINAEGDNDVGPGSYDLGLTRVGANYHLNKVGSLQPYLGAGVGYYRLKPELPGRTASETSFDVGFGIKHFFNDKFFFRGDAKAIRAQHLGTWDFAVGLGLGYAFGGVSSAPAVVTASTAVDSDGDGVLDSADACANTPAGTRVDARGCEIDSDRDGVVDSRDNCPDTPTNLAVDANGCPILEAQQRRQQLLVNFDFDQAVVKGEFDDEIATFAQFMRQYTNTNAVIEGHTDSDGSESYNQELSERRAVAVMNELVNNHNIPTSRLSAIGYGESRPVGPNSDAAGKQRNRRIEAEISVQVQEQRPR